MTCYQHMFTNDADHPYRSLCDCGKRYEEHPIDNDYETEQMTEQMMRDLEMEAEYESRLTSVEPDTSASQPVNPECGAG